MQLTIEDLKSGLREAHPIHGTLPITSVLPEGVIEDFVDANDDLGLNWQELSATSPAEALALGMVIGANAQRIASDHDTESASADEAPLDPFSEEPAAVHSDHDDVILTPWGESVTRAQLRTLTIPAAIEQALGGPDQAREAIVNAPAVEVLPGITVLSIPISEENLDSLASSIGLDVRI